MTIGQNRRTLSTTFPVPPPGITSPVPPPGIGVEPPTGFQPLLAPRKPALKLTEVRVTAPGLLLASSTTYSPVAEVCFASYFAGPGSPSTTEFTVRATTPARSAAFATWSNHAVKPPPTAQASTIAAANAAISRREPRRRRAPARRTAIRSRPGGAGCSAAPLSRPSSASASSIHSKTSSPSSTGPKTSSCGSPPAAGFAYIPAPAPRVVPCAPGVYPIFAEVFQKVGVKGVTAASASDTMVLVEVGGNYVDRMRGRQDREIRIRGIIAGQK